VNLLVGLGNPGIRYRWSRHNAGFLVLDRLALRHDILVQQTLFEALIGKGKIAGRAALLAKPQTFMNLSGSAVRRLVDYFRIDCAEMIVAHDDLDLPFGTIRLKVGGGHGGHKGLISLIDHLGTADFMRLRLGIGRPARKSMVEGYVLEPFSEQEMEGVDEWVCRAAEAITDTLSSGIQSAMDKHHRTGKTNLIEEG
jgi:PTH1 family peptidyl-tRNA hydrolase